MIKSYLYKIQIFLFLTLTFNISCSTAIKTTSYVKGPQVHDVAQPFLSFWEHSKDLSDEKKVEQFQKEIIPLFPEFYKARIERWIKRDKNPDALLAQQLREFPQIKASFTSKTIELSKSVNQSLQTFRNEFPEMNPNFEIYVIHSLGEMDGGTRQYGEKSFFILGIDGMVKYHHDFISEVPFFHHELFHVYHAQYLTEDMRFWIALWGEGLATYVAEKLNPKAPIKDLMLSEIMITQVNQNIAFYWKDLLTKLESKNEKDYEKYFLLSSTDKQIANRAGYYLGYLIAKEAAKHKSIPELVKLNPSDTIDLIRQTIETLRTHRN